MRKITFLFIAALAVVWAGSAGAALEFDADFAGNGIYNISWPMKPGDEIPVDIYVSNVPAPGLISMGFKLVYDPDNLEIVPSGTEVHLANWPIPYLETGTPGEIEMAGFFVLEEDEDEGHKGDHIRLGTVTFRCIGEGTGELMLLDRAGDWFVLFSEEGEPTVLDGDIGAGVVLATIRPAVHGDIDGDGAVDLADAILVLQMMTHMHQSYLHVNAEVNGDDRIGLPEVIYILQEISGMR